mmetsp:Transcript_11920/g.36739  ORF Transcript_11920/g.36739 Transcript_11920/m.36739 type:complete len:251 (-) Transcript_11920:156-908(-)
MVARTTTTRGRVSPPGIGRRVTTLASQASASVVLVELANRRCCETTPPRPSLSSDPGFLLFRRLPSRSSIMRLLQRCYYPCSCRFLLIRMAQPGLALGPVPQLSRAWRPQPKCTLGPHWGPKSSNSSFSILGFSLSTSVSWRFAALRGGRYRVAAYRCAVQPCHLSLESRLPTLCIVSPESDARKVEQCMPRDSCFMRLLPVSIPSSFIGLSLLYCFVPHHGTRSVRRAACLSIGPPLAIRPLRNACLLS